MSLDSFLRDLILTINKRSEQTKKYMEATSRLKNNLSELFTLSKYDFIQMYNEGLLKNFIIDLFLQKSPLSKEENTKIIESFRKDKWADFRLVEKFRSKLVELEVEDNGDWDQFYDFFANEFLIELDAYIRTYLESVNIFRKYKKTYLRTLTVLDIGWNAISNEYKILLLSTCNSTSDPSLKLFDLNEVCKSFMNCKTNNIQANTSNCIENIKSQQTLYSSLP